MTHDELLAKIDEEGKDYYANFVVIAALRAVVELHKPEKVVTSGGTILEYQTSITVCSQCKRIAGYEIGYPCPTIQAIEKELE